VHEHPLTRTELQRPGAVPRLFGARTLLSADWEGAELNSSGWAHCIHPVPRSYDVRCAAHLHLLLQHRRKTRLDTCRLAGDERYWRPGLSCASEERAQALGCLKTVAADAHACMPTVFKQRRASEMEKHYDLRNDCGDHNTPSLREQSAAAHWPPTVHAQAVPVALPWARW